jgi:3-hydroxyisobutyrate dehydrogenase-like beta-hydroxyacid dehydrogenase
MSTMNGKIGFIGLGLMGHPMCLRLIQAGFGVTIWNRTKHKTASLIDAGASPASNPSEVAGNSELVFLCLTDSAAVSEVVFGQEGLVSKRPPKTIVDFSTIGFKAAHDLGTTLSNKHQVVYVDAPVTGGVVGAQNGTLTMFAGGETSTIDHIMPILKRVASNVVNVGSYGTGQVTKICNQVMVMTTMVAMAEMLKLAEHGGITSKNLPRIFADGFANSKILEVFGAQMASRDTTLTGKLKIAQKDLELILSLGRETGTSLPMSGTATQMVRLAIGKGLGENDITQFIQLYDD